MTAQAGRTVLVTRVFCMSPDTTLISGSMAYPEGETAFCLGVSCALFLFILIVVLAYARSVLRRPAELAYDAGVRRYSADRRRTTHGQGWGAVRRWCTPSADLCFRSARRSAETLFQYRA